MPNKNDLKFTQDFQVVGLKKEKMLPVPESDWEELKSEVSSFGNYNDSFFSKIDFGQLLIGAFLSSIFSLIALYNSHYVKEWLFITNWVITITTFLVGFLFLFLNKEKEKRRKIHFDKAYNKIVTIENKHNV